MTVKWKNVGLVGLSLLGISLTSKDVRNWISSKFEQLVLTPEQQKKPNFNTTALAKSLSEDQYNTLITASSDMTIRRREWDDNWNSVTYKTEYTAFIEKCEKMEARNEKLCAYFSRHPMTLLDMFKFNADKIKERTQGNKDLLLGNEDDVIEEIDGKTTLGEMLEFVKAAQNNTEYFIYRDILHDKKEFYACRKTGMDLKEMRNTLSVYNASIKNAESTGSEEVEILRKQKERLEKRISAISSREKIYSPLLEILQQHIADCREGKKAIVDLNELASQCETKK